MGLGVSMPLHREQLERLRLRYLEGTAGEADYWDSDELLASYDATFARRIGWKWQWVFGELDRAGWRPPEGGVFDWGCGTGVAVREFLGRYGPAGRAVSLHDRSARARRYAAAAVRREHPETVVSTTPPERPFVLLVSHVITELDDSGLQELLSAAREAEAVLWVEPGSREASARLVNVRERLREVMHPVAPCLHRNMCGLLMPEHDRDWCHFFVPPPNEVFTSSEWAAFGKAMGIDLRSLPVSFLVLDRRPPAPWPPGAVRVIGNRRLFKGHALLQGCDAAGVHDLRFTKRTDPAYFRAMSKGRTQTLQEWQVEGTEIVRAREIPE